MRLQLMKRLKQSLGNLFTKSVVPVAASSSNNLIIIWFYRKVIEIMFVTSIESCIVLKSMKPQTLRLDVQHICFDKTTICSVHLSDSDLDVKKYDNGIYK